MPPKVLNPDPFKDERNENLYPNIGPNPKSGILFKGKVNTKNLMTTNKRLLNRFSDTLTGGSVLTDDGFLV